MAAFGGDANVLATNAISTNLSHQSRNASMPSIRWQEPRNHTSALLDTPACNEFQEPFKNAALAARNSETVF
jgi:hypothetical protein